MQSTGFKSGLFGGHMWGSMNVTFSRRRYLGVFLAVCDGAPSCRRHPCKMPVLLLQDVTSSTTFIGIRYLLAQTNRPLRHLRSFKVTDFGTNWMLICDFLLVINSNLPPILHRFHVGRLFVEFSLSIEGCLTLTPPLGAMPCEYPDKLSHQKLLPDA